MHYHIILTERCNLRCKYCYEKSMQEFDNGLADKFDYDMTTPTESQVTTEQLQKFLKPTDYLIFYGGEPLTQIDKIKDIIDNVKVAGFRIQTNAILTKELPISYWKKIDKILVSIDGNEERTDNNRGQGKYKIIIENVRWLRDSGYKGEIVARMTISPEFPDILKQVTHLLSLTSSAKSTPSEAYSQRSVLPAKRTPNYRIFDSIHWQLDAEFYKFDYNKDKFQTFVNQYNKQITKLLDFWLDEIKNGKVIKLYPFLGITQDLLLESATQERPRKGSPSGNKNTTSEANYQLPTTNCGAKLRCGSGHSNFTINTSGNLSACPIINSAKNFYCGNLENGIIREIHPGNWCKDCNYLNICGGRCLYSNVAQLWPKEGHDQVCQTIQYLIEEIKARIPQIQQSIEQNKVSLKDFEFEKYFGPEIIP